MLAFAAPHAGERKLRLFAVACYRRVWSRLGAGRRRMVEVAEHYAAHSLGEVERDNQDLDWLAGLGYFDDAAACRAAAARRALAEPFRWAGAVRTGVRDAAESAEAAAQCDLLRCLLGNPFRSAVLAPAWLAAEGGSAPTLARVISAEGRFEDLPVLADALEEGGCDQRELLEHLRQPGGHVRGCWALDLVLGLAGPQPR
jgi:hypothetical protein